jgi:hypothetical protein
MQTLSPPPHRPLRLTLIAASGVIGLTFLGAVVLYLATVGLLYLRDNFCDGRGSSIWCRNADIAKLPILPNPK